MSRIRNPLHLEVVPAPGTFPWEEIQKRIELVLPFAESIHIDVADGKFVSQVVSLDPTPFKKYAGRVVLEAHFMTDNPMQYIQSFADNGFTRFIGQVEKMPDITEFIAQAQLCGEAGLGIDGPTSLSVLDSVNLDDLDVVQFYTGEKAGFSGATMLSDRLQKAMELRGRDQFLPIEIDGGVDDKNILLAKDAGVTRFVTTGFIFNGNPEEQSEKLENLIHS